MSFVLCVFFFFCLLNEVQGIAVFSFFFFFFGACYGMLFVIFQGTNEVGCRSTYLLSRSASILAPKVFVLN